MPRDLKRSDGDLMDAAGTIFHDAGSLESFVGRAESAAIFRRGDKARRRNAAGDEDDGAGPEDLYCFVNMWAVSDLCSIYLVQCLI